MMTTMINKTSAKVMIVNRVTQIVQMTTKTMIQKTRRKETNTTTTTGTAMATATDTMEILMMTIKSISGGPACTKLSQRENDSCLQITTIQQPEWS
jgi:hypothetical protein